MLDVAVVRPWSQRAKNLKQPGPKVGKKGRVASQSGVSRVRSRTKVAKRQRKFSRGRRYKRLLDVRPTFREATSSELLGHESFNHTS